MSTWASPPPPPPTPWYPLDTSSKDDDGRPRENPIVKVLGQAIFIFLMVVCQHPELIIGPLRQCCRNFDVYMRSAVDELGNAARNRDRRADGGYDNLRDDDDEEAGSRAAGRPASNPRVPSVRVQLHPKLAGKFQSRIDAMRERAANLTSSTRSITIPPRRTAAAASMEEWAEGHIPGAFEVNFDMTVS